jgi:integrase
MLTDMQIRKAKPTEKPQKLSDSGGLFLFVPPTGSKLWRQAFRFNGKQLLLSHGAYPKVSLTDARKARDEAKDKLSRGIDPRVKVDVGDDTFGAIAQEFLAKVTSEEKSPLTIAKKQYLLGLLSEFNDRPVASITAPELLKVLRKTEDQRKFETTHRTKSLFSQIARYAIATGRAERDISTDLRGALTTAKVVHRAAITNPKKVGALLRAIDGYDFGATITRLALQLLALTFVRPGELRSAEWSEIDGDVWIIPASKMKMKREHRVPLSKQALSVIEELRAITGKGKYLFPCLYATQRTMSENTLSQALRRMGYDQDDMTPHGFRAMAATLLNECGKWNPDAIERQLAHTDRNAVRRAYQRAEFWDERKIMMQWWADYLDGLK